MLVHLEYPGINYSFFIGKELPRFRNTIKMNKRTKITRMVLDALVDMDKIPHVPDDFVVESITKDYRKGMHTEIWHLGS